jgi:hypothetical protein
MLEKACTESSTSSLGGERRFRQQSNSMRLNVK